MSPWNLILSLFCLCHLTTALRLDDWAFPFGSPRRLQDTPYQSSPDGAGPSYVSAVSYNKESNAVHITGSTYGSIWDSAWYGDTSACFYAVLKLNDNSPQQVYSRVFGNEQVSQSCQNILVDENNSRVYLVGHNTEGGVLSDFENVGGLADPDMFGMFLDLQYNDISVAEATPSLVGGHVWLLADVIYPMAIAKQSGDDTVYVVFLVLEPSTQSPNYIAGASQDPAKVFQYGDSYKMNVAALPLLPVTDPSSLSNTLQTNTWIRDLTPTGGPVLNIAGIINLNGWVFVGGSTAGQGQGFGERNVDGADEDGFVSRFSETDGSITSLAQANLGGNPTWRAWSADGYNDRINGLCASEQTQEFIYATGSTDGFLEDTEPGVTSQKKAFLAKIRISDMAAVWVQYVDTRGNNVIESEGISCTVSDDGNSIFFAGNVKGGSIDDSATASSTSYGGSDVFVAKVGEGTAAADEILFVKQFGTANEDFVAQRKGLETVGSSGDSVIIVGNTKGAMYRGRTGDEQDFSTVFAVVMSSDGSYTRPTGTGSVIQPSTPSTTAPPPATTPATTAATTPATTSATTPATLPTPSPTRSPVTPTPPGSENKSKKSNRRREDWEALMILLFVGISVTCCAMGVQQYWYHKREAATDRSKVLDYLQNFDVEDIDLKHSATGGWHCSYVNDLARGVNVQNSSLSSDRGFMGDSDYHDTAFDPLNSAVSSPNTPESKVLEDSLFVIEDGEEMLTFGNDRASRDGLGQQYSQTWSKSNRSLNGKNGDRRRSKSKDTWGREII